jgi:malate permease and related proteins
MQRRRAPNPGRAIAQQAAWGGESCTGGWRPGMGLREVGESVHAGGVRELMTVVGAVVPVILVVMAGWWMRRVDWLTEEADASLLRVTINVLMPCLIVDSLVGSQALGDPGNVFVPPLIGFGTVTLGLGVAGLVARWIPPRAEATRRTFVYSVAIYNYGYVPLPLALTLFDRETAAVLFVHNIGVELALWVYGLTWLAGRGLRDGMRRLLTPPVLAIVGALVMNAMVSRESVPGVVWSTVHWLGGCAIPMGLILIGAVMADHARDFVSRQGGRVMGWACVLRLGVLPLMFLGLAWVLPLGVELKRVVLLQAAMPAAVFPIIIARQYGGDPATAVRVVVATSLGGLITIPLWLRAGMSWLEL